MLSCIWLFMTLWTVARQAPLSTEFSRQGYCSELPFPSAGDLPNRGIEPESSALQADSLPSETPGYWCMVGPYSTQCDWCSYNKRREVHSRKSTMWLWRIQEKNLPAKHWHLLSASTGINHEPLWLMTFNNPSKEFGVEVKNEALCALGKPGRTGL